MYLTAPPSALAPNSVPCGPFKTSMRVEIEQIDVECLEAKAELRARAQRNIVEIEPDRASQLSRAGRDAADGNQVARRSAGREAQAGTEFAKSAKLLACICSSSVPVSAVTCPATFCTVSDRLEAVTITVSMDPPFWTPVGAACCAPAPLVHERATAAAPQ
jgi:hypothetical protein